MNWASDIRAVLFDFDDTLMQTKKFKIDAIKMLGQRYYNVEIEDALIEKHWGIAFSDFYANVFESIDDDIDRILKRRKDLNVEYPNRPYDDAKDVLNYLVDKYQVGIVTSSSRETVGIELNGADLPIAKLSFIQTAEDTFYHKPNPKVFDPAIQILSNQNIFRHQILYVGDAILDFNAANEAGLKFVGIANNTTPAKKFKKVNAAFVTNLTALKKSL